MTPTPLTIRRPGDAKSARSLTAPDERPEIELSFEAANDPLVYSWKSLANGAERWLGATKAPAFSSRISPTKTLALHANPGDAQEGRAVRR